ncbi:MAG: FHA domain-containing protein, partial [Myxococcales bacterium]|nr:FHA domain-containing protein [Myxococcales bacterium]
AALHTSNGTFVNGSQIRTHTLRPGDVIEIGPATLRFHQEPESPMRGGENVRFASQLKGFPEMPGGEGGKTVLGLAPESELDDGLDLGEDLSHLGPVNELQFELGGDQLEAAPMPGAAPGAPVAAPEVVPPILEIDGFAEEDDGFGDDLTEAALAELEKEEPPAIDAPAVAPPAPPPEQVEAPAAPAQSGPAVESAPVREAVAEPAPAATATARAATVQLQVELEGPRDALREVVAALLDQEISIPPLKVRLRRPPKS